MVGQPSIVPFATRDTPPPARVCADPLFWQKERLEEQIREARIIIEQKRADRRTDLSQPLQSSVMVRTIIEILSGLPQYAPLDTKK
jgi:hypothetical protein